MPPVRQDSGNTTIYASVTMRQKNASHFIVTVDVMVATGLVTQVVVQDPTLWQVSVFTLPELPKTAVAAACYSGTFYALRKIDSVYPVDFGHFVAVSRAAGMVYDNTTPWTTATFVGICHLTNHPDLITDYELNGWELVDCTISHPLY